VKILVCGDRNWTHREYLEQVLIALGCEYGYPYTIIQGGARGADTMAFYFARDRGLLCETYRAEWTLYGRAAGAIRNAEMLKDGKPDLVVAFHNDLENSKGTKNMVSIARKAGVPVRVFTSNGEV